MPEPPPSSPKRRTRRGRLIVAAALVLPILAAALLLTWAQVGAEWTAGPVTLGAWTVEGSDYPQGYSYFQHNRPVHPRLVREAVIRVGNRYWVATWY